jgi:hypothetical protein
LHVDEIDAAVSDAVRLNRMKDEIALANASRDCERRFRDNPGTQGCSTAAPRLTMP